jgi:class 3 adenylate cyclase/tetratricopeptide (TPR) repeat protein
VRKSREELRKLAAIMFADMVGFSALKQDLAIECREEMLALAQDTLRVHGGRLVNTMGDGFLAEFSTALSALKCAVELQKSIQQRNETAATQSRFRLRLGLHIGEVVVQGDNIVGSAVNLTARLEPLAAPGGVAMSEELFQQVRDDLDLPIQRLGTFRLKHLAQPVTIYHLQVQPSTRGVRFRHQFRVRFMHLHRGARTALAAAALILTGIGLWQLDLPWRRTTDQLLARAEALLKRYDRPQNLAQAEKMLKMAYDRDKQSADVLSDLARLYWFRFSVNGDEPAKGKAQWFADQAIICNSNSPQAQLVRGLLLEAEGKHEEGVPALQRAADLSKGSEVTIAANLAYAYSRIGEWAKAEQLFDEIVLHNKSPSWDFYYMRGNYNRYRMQWNKAIADYKSALQLTPDNCRVLDNLAGAFLAINNVNGAKEACRRSLQVREGPAPHSTLGTCYLAEHKPRDAAYEFGQAAQLAPTNFVYFGNQGLALLDVPDRDGAIRALEEAVSQADRELRLHPDNAETLARLAVYLAAVGRGEESRAKRELAVRLGASNNSVLYNALDAAKMLSLLTHDAVDSNAVHQLEKRIEELRRKPSASSPEAGR